VVVELMKSFEQEWRREQQKQQKLFQESEAKRQQEGGHQGQAMAGQGKESSDAKNTSSRRVAKDDKKTKEELETSAGQEALNAICDSTETRSSRGLLLSDGEARRRKSVWSIARERKTKRAQWLRFTSFI